MLGELCGVWIAGTGLLDEEVQEGWVWRRWRPRLLAHASNLGNILVGLHFLKEPPSLNTCIFSFTRRALSGQQLWEPDLKFNRSIKLLVLTF